MKKFIFDLETTGLDSKKHGIIQIAGIIKLPGDVIHKFDFKCKPFPGQQLDPIALAITGNTPESIATFHEPKKVYKALVHLLGQYVDKLFF